MINVRSVVVGKSPSRIILASIFSCLLSNWSLLFALDILKSIGRGFVYLLIMSPVLKHKMICFFVQIFLLNRNKIKKNYFKQTGLLTSLSDLGNEKGAFLSMILELTFRNRLGGGTVINHTFTIMFPSYWKHIGNGYHKRLCHHYSNPSFSSKSCLSCNCTHPTFSSKS